MCSGASWGILRNVLKNQLCLTKETKNDRTYPQSRQKFLGA